MDASSTSRLLSIGEFAAATQLTPKALRLYDEQGLLRPATVDAANGYRYYVNTQVAAARLIRTLREMNASLSDIAQIVAAPEGRAEMLLTEVARESERRHAREKRAFHSALMLMRGASRRSALAIEEADSPAFTASVHVFSADRENLWTICRSELTRARDHARRSSLHPTNSACCVLREPVSEDESQVELLVAIDPPQNPCTGTTLRYVEASHCGRVAVANIGELIPALDALFDWFDRGGHRAAGPPMVRLDSEGAPREVLWPFQTINTAELPP